MKVCKVCDTIIRWGFYLLAIIVPLILTPWNYELFEFNKMVVTYTLTAIIVSAWLVKMGVSGRFQIAKTPLDIPIGLFLISQLVSTVFSIDPHVSWLGYYSRFNGGMWSVITYILLYYSFVSNFIFANEVTANTNIKYKISNSIKENSDRFIYRFLQIILTTAVVVALYGLLERLGIDKNIWVQDVQSRVFSTLGQPNWLAAYLVALIPLVTAVFISKIDDRRLKIGIEGGKSIKKNFLSIFRLLNLPSALYLLISALFFFVLLSTRSRSGLLGLAVAEVIFWGLFFSVSSNRKQMIAPFAFIHAAFFLVVFFNGSYIPQIDKYFTLSGLTANLKSRTDQSTPTAAPSARPAGTLLDYGGTESGTIRKYVWQAAVDAWRASTKNTLIGTGTETFAWTFFRYRPVGHNLVSEWDFLYNKAHNEYLNFLATTGIFGLGSYLFFIILFSIRFIKFQFSNIKHRNQNTSFSQTALPNQNSTTYNQQLLSVALFSGWISILVTNFFGFSVVIIQHFFFLFPAIILTLNRSWLKFVSLPLRKFISKSLAVTAPLAGITIVAIIWVYWYADTLYAKGYRLNRSGMPQAAKPLLEDAIVLNPGEPNFHDELANALSAITVIQAENGDTQEAVNTAKSSLVQNDMAISISPNNVNFWKTRTKILYGLSTYDAKFNQMATEALTKALELSPNDPKIVYNLAILYGRENDPVRSIAFMEKAKSIKPNYRDAYYGLSVMYAETGQTAKSKDILQEYLEKVDPNDTEFKEKVK